MMKKIILASGSPRRKMLLEQLGLKFEVVPADYIETMKSGMTPEEIARYLSLRKAQAVAKNYPDAVVIAADTFGVISGKIIGKPHNDAEAARILRTLSSRSHRVITGFTVMEAAADKAVSRSSVTTVHFRELSDQEIDAYIHTGEPLDKAGAYGIQGLGAVLVDRIEGDYYNVIGLPLSPLAEVLKSFDIDVLKNTASESG